VAVSNVKVRSAVHDTEQNNSGEPLNDSSNSY